MFFCSFVRFFFCFAFLLSNVHWSACRTVIGQIYDSSFALLSYGDSLARFDGCSIALHDVRWLASFDDCLIDNASSQIGWGVTSLSLVVRRKTPLPPFQPIKSQARKNCNKFRWIATHFSRAWLRLLSAPCVRFLTGSCVFSACILLSSVFQRKIKTVYATLPSHIQG